MLTIKLKYQCHIEFVRNWIIKILHGED